MTVQCKAGPVNQESRLRVKGKRLLRLLPRKANNLDFTISIFKC